jgi:phage replication initiation protein
MRKSISNSALSGSALVKQEISDMVRRNLADPAPYPEVLQAVEKISASLQPADLDPPSANRGGSSPLPPYFLPHGEISHETVAKDLTFQYLQKQKTKIDWITFSTVAGLEALQVSVNILFPSSVITSGGKMKGYPKARLVEVDGVTVATIGHGATHGRDCVAIDGAGCKLLTHADVIVLHDLMHTLEARITRLDLCLDFYSGETTWDHALFAYHRGSFRHPKANCNPEHSIVGKESGDGQNLGRTLYVGQRASAVMARIYEKGLETFAKLPKEYREACAAREAEYRLLNGLKPSALNVDSWLRVEIEFKNKDDKVLSYDMLLDRDMYFSGAYPYCADCLGVEMGPRPATLKDSAEVTLDRMLIAARRSYGNLVHSLTEIGFTDGDIVGHLTTGLHNQKLVKAGVVAVGTRAAKGAAEKLQAERAAAMSALEDFDIPF